MSTYRMIWETEWETIQKKLHILHYLEMKGVQDWEHYPHHLREEYFGEDEEDEEIEEDDLDIVDN